MYISEHFKSVVYDFLKECKKEIKFSKKEKINNYETVKLIVSIMLILNIITIEED